MCRLFNIGAAIVASLAIAYGVTTPTWRGIQSVTGENGASANMVDQTHKGDRQPLHKEAATSETVIATVEVIGLRNAAVVYRARDGRELFRSDPLRNTTVVVKGVTLPEVTIRDARKSTVETMPADMEQDRGHPARPAKAKNEEGKMLEGCDPAFSPLAASKTTNFSSRCIAANEPSVRVAAALN